MLHVLILRDADECASCDEVAEEFNALKGEFPEMRIRQRLLSSVVCSDEREGYRGRFATG